MTAEVLERTAEARLVSLRTANEVRFARAQMKRDLRAGAVDARALLSDPPYWLRSMKLWKFLAAIPTYGARKTRRLMLVARVSESKTVGGLSDRQRCEVVALLEARMNV